MVIEILRQAKSGDKDAQGKLYEMYYAPLFRFVLSRTKNRELTQDIVQDVFVKFIGSLHSFQIIYSDPLPYLYRAAKNTIINEGTKKKSVYFEEGEEELIVSELPTPEEEVIRNEESRTLLAHIQTLPSLYREVIELKCIAERSTKEIAQILSKTEANIRKIESRAIAMLKEKYIQYEQ
jgi:RNA polymerase sigma factor (sigma-70 family)